MAHNPVALAVPVNETTSLATWPPDGEYSSNVAPPLTVTLIVCPAVARKPQWCQLPEPTVPLAVPVPSATSMLP